MNKSSCESCKYYDQEFGCLCNLPIYPCEQEEINDIIDDLDFEI